MSDRFRSVRGARWLPLALAWVLFPRVALAEDPKKAECAAAYERSQELRVGGKLTKAEAALALCAQDACPAFVQTDCAQWLTEVRRDLPTVVFTAKDQHGEETTAVHVSVDGDEILSELDGKAVSVDPGTHRFQFEMEGAEPIKQELMVKLAEKDRVIEVNFAPHEADAPIASPYPPKSKEPEKDTTTRAATGRPGPLRPYAFAAGGVGAAGILGFVVFGAMGSSKQSELDASCGLTHSCAQSDVDSIKTKYLLADVSLGVGIAGLGAGVALFLLSQPKSDAPAKDEAALTHLDVRSVRDGAVATVSGRF